MDDTELVQLDRSGWLDWDFFGGGDGGEIMVFLLVLLLVPVTFVVNLFTHFVIFRGGWTIWVSAGGVSWKTRYPSKKAAQADLDHQRALAAAVPPLKPVRLPTRGGSLRRPR
ncbi:hypothetical protein [Streptomyces sp. SID13031]|uniref:hypothetical protein n=1 Tax=Streptomyces sp. SID13031 TaxID=2706046 RepID=UPI0013CB5EB7|nr:hypothetical protein [Streptomyces sp. SID13031]NEA35346.1 hypothetical protein [Streptomyces sp. SID13031]